MQRAVLSNVEAARWRALETLLNLHLDFIEIGRLREAGPFLHLLMGIAHSSPSSAKSAGKRRRRAPPKRNAGKPS